MNPNYRPDRIETGALMRSSEIADHLETVAKEAQRYAESIAPDAPMTGEGYVASFRIERDEQSIARERRAVVRLVNDAEHAAVVESKTHVLARTRDYIGQRHG